MRISSKGQVTIPAEIRAKLGLKPNTEVDFILRGSEVSLVKRGRSKKPSRGKRAVDLLCGSATRGLGMSVDDYLKLTRG
jgi:AbrB family looped-hinge helix DNA binding protein